MPLFHRPTTDFSRRTVLTAGGLAWLTGSAYSETTPPAAAQRVLRLAHLTDVHVQPELRAPLGMAACLQHMQGLADPPELVLFGGDCIMDAFSQSKARTEEQWDIWHKVLRDELAAQLPWHGCIGNHDVWGWNGAAAQATDDPRHGKAWAVEALQLPHRFYSFEQAGWKFLVLDSTHPGSRPGSYTAKLDPEQLEWLQGELEQTPATQPVLILSHIPIFAACPFLDGQNEKSGDWQVPGAWMHIDARRLIELFHQKGNVKVCLSGHIHLVDEVKYLGTNYYCNGAVSGGWWKGNCQQFAPGYAIVDLYADGSSRCEYIPWGWQPPA